MSEKEELQVAPETQPEAPPVKLDNEIPDELLEFPPPETLQHLDKQLDGVPR